MRWVSAVFLFLCLLVVPAIYPQTIPSKPDILKLSNDQDEYDLTSWFYVLNDDSAKLGFKDIHNGNLPFEKNRREYISYGFSSSAIWVKFYADPGTSGNSWYLFSGVNMLDSIEIYTPDEKGKYTTLVSGNSVAVSDRIFHHRRYIYPVQMRPDLPVYVRVWSVDNALDIDFKLFSAAGLQKHLEKEALETGLLLGIVLLVAFYNLVIYLTVRDRSYLFYLLYIVFYWITIFEVNGFVYYLFFPDNYPMAQNIRIFAANFGAAFAIYFGINFIQLRKNFPRYARFLEAIAWVLVANALFVREMEYGFHNIVFFSMLLVSCVGMIVSGVISLRIFDYARYYLFAWLVFLIILSIYSIRMFGVYIPYFTQNSLSIGGAMEVLLLSFALGKRIQSMRRESEEMRIEALEKGIRLDTLNEKNQALEKDLDLARNIQRSMIPALKNYPDLHSVFMPMEKVGGDFFDVIELDPGRRAIFFCDVTGHGVAAAFVTTLVKSSISNEARRYLIDPSSPTWLADPRAAFQNINELLTNFSGKQYLSAVYGILDRNEKTFSFVSANHPPLLYLTPEEDLSVKLEFLKSSPQAPLLGIWPDQEFRKKDMKVTTHSLQEGSRLVFCSDGFFETVGFEFPDDCEGIECFEESGLYELLKRSFEMDAGEMNRRFRETLQDILASASPVDDICVLCVQN